MLLCGGLSGMMVISSASDMAQVEVKPRNQVDDGGFAAAGVADKSYCLTDFILESSSTWS